jgi:hypothetical protein
MLELAYEKVEWRPLKPGDGKLSMIVTLIVIIIQTTN